ncbi:putative testis-expressed protein 13C [Heterocephalus glaber]|uniref:Testis-expressed protein 13C n=1 Tax=Heterocephalus glaber TaxID=10181 RepID=A0AAX6PVT3_HETGA|nr:putative testis-expressed protein 13C [Heterocephalus glaber]
MAVEFGDPTSGFRHTEVIRFINNEILMNGGGQDFYLTFRSRPWNEVEDALQNILSDQQIPRRHKRACAWSALALAVRVAVTQREQHMRRVRRLKEQLGAREALSWALASELQQLRQQRDQAATQLYFTRSALHRAQSECDLHRRRLLQFERCAQVAPLARDIVPGPRAEQLGAVAWPPNAEQQRDVWAMREHGRLSFETLMRAPTSAIYMPRSPSSRVPSSWALTMPSPMPVLVPPSFPLHVPFPMGLPSLPLLTPTVVTEPKGVIPFQMSPVGICPPGPLTTWGFQDKIASLWDQSCHDQVEGPEMLQVSVPGDNRSLSQEDLHWPQGMPVLGERGYHRQEKDSERPQEMTPLGDRGKHNHEEGPLWPQGVPFLGENWQYSQEEDQERPQEMTLLGDSRSHSQEDSQEGAQSMVLPGFSDIQIQAEGTERAQGMTDLVINRSHSKEKDTECIQAMTAPESSRSHTQGGVEKGQGVIPSEFSRMQEDEERPQCIIPPGLKSHNQEDNVERAKGTNLWKSWSQAVRESPKKQHPQQQMAKQKQEKKALESQQQVKSVSCHSPVGWVCTWCKAMNFPWRTACYKCKKIHVPVESGDVDPEQTH